MTVNLLYVAWNRRAFTEATFQALVANTDWDLVDTLHVHDDGSTDGTKNWLIDAIDGLAVDVRVKFESQRLHGPVAAMNRHLGLFKETDDTKAFVKLDSDFVVAPGWLNELVRVSNDDPGCDIIGVQPRFGPPVAGESADRRIEAARHIGGIGLMRYRAFEVCHPVPNGLYGWTEFQTRHPENRKGWIVPDLPCFCLDLIDLEPWSALALQYVAKGWAREWPNYLGGGESYYGWWAQ